MWRKGRRVGKEKTQLVPTLISMCIGIPSSKNTPVFSRSSGAARGQTSDQARAVSLTANPLVKHFSPSLMPVTRGQPWPLRQTQRLPNVVRPHVLEEVATHAAVSKELSECQALKRQDEAIPWDGAYHARVRLLAHARGGNG
jgi:hypothetical protein